MFHLHTNFTPCSQRYLMPNNKYVFVAFLCLLICLMGGVYRRNKNYQKQATQSHTHKKMDTAYILLVGGLVLSCAKYVLGFFLLASKHARKLVMDFSFKFPSIRRAVLTMAKSIKEKFPQEFQGAFNS